MPPRTTRETRVPVKPLQPTEDDPVADTLAAARAAEDAGVEHYKAMQTEMANLDARHAAKRAPTQAKLAAAEEAFGALAAQRRRAEQLAAAKKQHDDAKNNYQPLADTSEQKIRDLHTATNTSRCFASSAKCFSTSRQRRGANPVSSSPPQERIVTVRATGLVLLGCPLGFRSTRAAT